MEKHHILYNNQRIHPQNNWLVRSFKKQREKRICSVHFLHLGINPPTPRQAGGGGARERHMPKHDFVGLRKLTMRPAFTL